MTSKTETVRRWRVFVNGTAYCGMLEVNDDGTAGPNLRAGDCDFVVAKEATGAIERLSAERDEAIKVRNQAILENNTARHERDGLRAALEGIAKSRLITDCGIHPMRAAGLRFGQRTGVAHVGARLLVAA